MWDRPALLNGLANTLFAVAALLALYLAWTLATRLPMFELREVTVGSELTRVTRKQIESVVQRELAAGNLATLDLGAVRDAFEVLPWVRRVQVRRRWPARLEVAFEEHVPLARWASTALVNTHGEVFKAAYDGELPVFIGPDGTAREIAIQFRYFHRSLQAIGQTPMQIEVSPRRAWRLKLQSGLTLELGREQVEARLTRFIAVYDRTFGQLGRRFDHVDLRYANGFAVRFPDQRPGRAEPRRSRGAGA
jgi:cell division protein FtsQ